jgi:signal peptidase I
MSTSAQIGNSIVSQASALSRTGGRVVDPEELRLKRIRQSIVAILAFLLVLISFRIFCLEGLVFPVRVAGASMAPTLVGAHYHVTCDDCGSTFDCDAHKPPGSQEAVCPFCAYTHNELDPGVVRMGDQVLVDHWVYLLGRPQRGDIVAFSHVDDDSERVVKRIVGLPGEKISIRRGDVYINDKPWQKGLHQLKRQAILVHDNSHAPTKTKNLPARWLPAHPESNWIERNQAFIYNGRVPPGKAPDVGMHFDWLSFRSWLGSENPKFRTKPSPVLDNDSYNQGLNREGQLNDVPDLLLTCRASTAKYGCLVFAAVDGADRFEVHMCHDIQKLKTYQNGKEINVTLLPHRRYDEPVNIEFALCDQRVLFGMDGREVLRQPYVRTKPNAPQQEPQLQIGGAGARIRISQVKVWRDLYYLPPSNARLGQDSQQQSPEEWHAERAVPPHSYFVLGDNPPASVDSRYWPKAEVPLTAIRGKVVKPMAWGE